LFDGTILSSVEQLRRRSIDREKDQHRQTLLYIAAAVSGTNAAFDDDGYFLAGDATVHPRLWAFLPFVR